MFEFLLPQEDNSHLTGHHQTLVVQQDTTWSMPQTVVYVQKLLWYIETSDNIAYGHITHKQRSIISSEQKLRC